MPLATASQASGALNDPFQESIHNTIVLVVFIRVSLRFSEQMSIAFVIYAFALMAYRPGVLRLAAALG